MYSAIARGPSVRGRKVELMQVCLDIISGEIRNGFRQGSVGEANVKCADAFNAEGSSHGRSEALSEGHNLPTAL